MTLKPAFKPQMNTDKHGLRPDCGESQNRFLIRVNPCSSVVIILSAFTLIEMLIVIAIISVLAALIFPVTGAVNRAKIRHVAQGELAQIETAIESYKAKHGVYPPDSNAPGAPGNPNYVNQLYYELLGTTFDSANTRYTTLDGSSTLTNATPASLSLVFGPSVEGFVNSTKGGGDEGAVATASIKGLKPSQIGLLNNGVHILVCSIPWPKDNAYQPVPGGFAPPGLNPWRYVSSTPTNNPNSFDLWVDVMMGSKTNRISNWSEGPKAVGAP
jgi:prepilin-type N-terminal cleavage/methylation domain-containing protein